VKPLRPLLFLLCALAAASCAKDAASSSPSSGGAAFDPAVFVTKTLQASLAASDLGASAAKKGHGPELRALGAAMQSEQAQLRAAAVALARQKNVPMTNELDPKKAALRDNMDQLVWPQFDRAYALATVQEMNAQVAAFGEAAAKGDADLQAFAAKWLPMLKARQKVAVDLLNKLGGSPFGYPP
jgi:predicted outer membrane protein